MNRQLKTRIQPLRLDAIFMAELPLWPRISRWLKESAFRTTNSTMKAYCPSLGIPAPVAGRLVHA